LSSSLPLIGLVVKHHTSRPAIIPDTHNLEHISTFQGELIVCARLICPEDSNTVARVDIILRVVILKERQLLGLLAGNALW
jgi:hypothetical protein